MSLGDINVNEDVRGSAVLPNTVMRGLPKQMTQSEEWRRYHNWHEGTQQQDENQDPRFEYRISRLHTYLL